MIAPGMATTLLFLTTDAVIGKAALARALKKAVGDSLNRLTVDGRQSTNDTAIIMASGTAANRPIASASPACEKFTTALTLLCEDLTAQMALDAEGATRFFKVCVSGAASRRDAAKACRAIADYPLVKCAVHGGDPNWGRIICAAGSSGARVNPGKLSCRLGGVTVFRKGAPVKFDIEKVRMSITRKFHTIEVDLGAGRFGDFCYGCDLSGEYVRINAHYHT
jgi:glutamate N-acetyltransferase/amino-acid N-acetyltransferase